MKQVLAQYRQQLRKIASLLAQMTNLGQCDMMLSKDAEGMIDRLEKAVAQLMDKEVLVEKAKQAVLDLKMVLGECSGRVYFRFDKSVRSDVSCFISHKN